MTVAHSGRREFLGRLAATAGAAAGLSGEGVFGDAGGKRRTGDGSGNGRAAQCAQIKKDAALANAGMPIPVNRPNGDEDLYPNRIGAYHKGLPHNEIGEVEPKAYRAMLRALDSGRPADFEKIILGGNTKLSNPQGGLAFDLEACDSHQTFMATPPAMSSAWRAGEMVEDYWMALLRDVNFADYDKNRTVAAALVELNRLSDFRGPKQKNQVNAQTLFRGFMPGDLVGPYVS